MAARVGRRATARAGAAGLRAPPARRPRTASVAGVGPVHVETSADGVDLAVHVLAGTGAPAVLVHATGFHGLVLAPLAQLLGVRFTCVAPDLRGHGGSGAPADGDYSWDGFGLDVLAAARLATRVALADRGGGATRAERPVGFGHSLGGTALLLAEAREPGTFAALYCYEPILFDQNDRRPLDLANPMSDAARRRRARFASRREALDRYRARPPLALLDAAVLEAYVEHGFVDAADGAVELACSPETEALVFANGYACDALDRIGGITCPVVLAHGGASNDVGRGARARATAQLRDARLVEVDGLGHLGPLEDPAAVAESVLSNLGTAGA